MNQRLQKLDEKIIYTFLLSLPLEYSKLCWKAYHGFLVEDDVYYARYVYEFIYNDSNFLGALSGFNVDQLDSFNEYMQFELAMEIEYWMEQNGIIFN